MTAPITITTFACVTDNTAGTEVATNWPALVARLARFTRAPSKRAVPGWSPATYARTCACGDKKCPGDLGHRVDDNVIAVHALVLDLDKRVDGTPLDQPGADAALARLASLGLACVIHTSYSYAPPDRIALRAVIQLSRSVPAAEWERAWLAAVKYLAIHCEPSCCNPARYWYWPSAPPEKKTKEEPWSRVLDGAPLDVDAVVAAAPPPPPKKNASKAATTNTRAFDLAALMRAKYPDAVPHESRGHTCWDVPCPWEAEHTPGSGGKHDTVVSVGPDGALGFCCLHSHCTNRHWADFRRYHEPDWRPQTGPYAVVDGRFCRVEWPAEGPPKCHPLCNFVASIDEEIVVEDGAETTHSCMVSGALDDGTVLPPVRVLAGEFGELTWLALWGLRPNVFAGRGTRDQVRDAIQRMSAPTQRTIYARTGWAEVDGKPVYLYKGGAVGAEHVDVELASPHDRYVLPDRVVDVVDAIRTSAGLLDCGPATVVYVLLAAIYAAPLAEILRPDFLVWILGPSGARKTVLAVIAQQHFGATFAADRLPGTWTSTDNAIELVFHRAKDVLAVIDDFKPGTDPRIEARAARIMQNVGNGTSRQRLRADSSSMPDRPPRGVVVATGEQLPADPTGSGIARAVVCELGHGQVDLPKISALQARVERLPHATRAYVEWLAPQLPELRTELPARVLKLRDVLAVELAGSRAHPRKAGQIATLLVSIETFASFAREAGAIDEDSATRWLTDARRAFVALARSEAVHADADKPARALLRALRALLAQRRARLDPREVRDDGKGDRPPLIGWQCQDWVYLWPELCQQAVASWYREAARAWPHSTRALGKALEADAHLQPDPDGLHSARMLTCGGRRVRVWQLPAAELYSDDPDDDQPPQQELELDPSPSSNEAWDTRPHAAGGVPS